MIICGIYMIENLVNHKVYIGSSIDIEKRILHHSTGVDGKYTSAHLRNAIIKYGFDNFVYDVLITCHPDMLLYYEQQFLDAVVPDYNLSMIAGKVEMTEVVRGKIAAAMRGSRINVGRKHTAESRHINSLSKIGLRHSEETKRKISAAQKGKAHTVFTDEMRKKMSISQTGRKHSEETRHKISNTLKGNPKLKTWTGKKHSEESIKKMSQARKDYWKRRKELSL